MFNPNKASKDKEEKALKKKALGNIKQWSIEIIGPGNLYLS